MKNNILILSSFLLFSCSDFYQPAVVSARKEATQIGLEIMKNGGNSNMCCAMKIECYATEFRVQIDATAADGHNEASTKASEQKTKSQGMSENSKFEKNS